MLLVAEFLDGLRPNTRRADQADLEAFRAFVGTSKAEEAVRSLMSGGKSYTMEQFALYMEHLVRAAKAKTTICRYIATVRSALCLAEKKGLIDWTPPPRPPFPPAYKDT